MAGHVWTGFLVNPSTGSQTLAWDLFEQETTSEGCHIVVAYFKGVDLSDPIVDWDESADDAFGGKDILGLTYNTGDMMVLAAGSDDAGGMVVTDDDQTEIVNSTVYRNIYIALAYELNEGDAYTTGGTYEKVIAVVLRASGYYSSSSSSSSSSSRSSSSSSRSSSSSSSSSRSSSSSSSSKSSSSTSSSSRSFALGEVCWGHDTAVQESNTEDFTGNWTGTGTISGNSDAEIVTLSSGQYKDSEAWRLGVGVAVIRVDEYGNLGQGIVTVQYKTGATRIACEAVGSWTTYNGVSLTSAGWVKIRIINT